MTGYKFKKNMMTNDELIELQQSVEKIIIKQLEEIPEWALVLFQTENLDDRLKVDVWPSWSKADSSRGSFSKTSKWIKLNNEEKISSGDPRVIAELVILLSAAMDRMRGEFLDVTRSFDFEVPKNDAWIKLEYENIFNSASKLSDMLRSLNQKIKSFDSSDDGFEHGLFQDIYLHWLSKKLHSITGESYDSEKVDPYSQAALEEAEAFVASIHEIRGKMNDTQEGLLEIAKWFEVASCGRQKRQTYRKKNISMGKKTKINTAIEVMDLHNYFFGRPLGVESITVVNVCMADLPQEIELDSVLVAKNRKRKKEI